MKLDSNKIFMGALCAMLSFSCFSQEDTLKKAIPTVRGTELPVKSIPETRIVGCQLFVIPRNTDSHLDIRAIEELAPDDAGELITKLSGANLKSYGGLGGLKTVSFRSLGSQHTAIVVDGFSLSNNQTGQVNLGQIQTDNLTYAATANNPGGKVNIPVSSAVMGNAVELRTFEHAFSTHPVSIRANVRYGSFNQQNAYFSAKYNKKNKVMFSLFGKYRQADGDYDYSYFKRIHPSGWSS